MRTDSRSLDSEVVYAIDVEVFADSDGDGVGDFQGLIDRLDYLDRLGVSTLWLLPFYPSPGRDNGYDVEDYYGVDSRLGTLGDFTTFLEGAEDRGIDVLIDLVVNHTSNEHSWFQRARRDPDSPYRDYYVWVDDPPPHDPAKGSVFPGEIEDDRIWTYDETADAYYLHRFYPFQPDLDLTNPEVREEIHRVMRFWLELGVTGFRVDAAGLMTQAKRPGTSTPDDPHDLFREFKRVARSVRGDAILLAEADVPTTELRGYFGQDGDEMDLMLNFTLNAHLFHALALESPEPIVEGLARIPAAPPSGAWVNFLRNYDELNLGSLPDADREEIYERFAPDRSMRIYGRGIRRRLAPMLDGDPRHIKLAYSLLFSLPGVPMLVYGDEIGMGEDLSLAGRNAVRTPMQWTGEHNAGFSSAERGALVRPVVEDGPFGAAHVNVAAQRDDPESILGWMHRLIATRRESAEIGRTLPERLAVGPESVLVHRYRDDGDDVVVAHNLADEGATATAAFDGAPDHAVYRLLGDVDHELEDGALRLTFEPYGHGWFRVE